MKNAEVFIFPVEDYDQSVILQCLPDEIFSLINPGESIIIKPNWLRDSHLSRPKEWAQVITHPSVITAVLCKVLEKLKGKGRIIITDGPETAASFDKIMAHYPVAEWHSMANKEGVFLSVLDLRDEEWTDDGNVIVERKKLPGDPKGSTQVNLKDDASEFYNHKPANGYFGADSDIKETNLAHNGSVNLYRVSRTVIEGDVFINIPKLKTHKKAGITCNLKNLVGINTYRNYLPHNSIGTVDDGGDQFPSKNTKSKIESFLMPFIHQRILKYPGLARIFSPIIGIGKRIFGTNSETIRGGSWYGNDTLWRTILDINKVLLYSNSDGSMRPDDWSSAKKYISVVDGIIAGAGEGPKSPDAVKMGYLFCGSNPVAIDYICAYFMGYDPEKIPSVKNSFNVKRFPPVNFSKDEIVLKMENITYNLKELPNKYIVKVIPHRGWIGHIENIQL